MPVPVSSLSVAVQGIADFLDSQFGEDVVISVAHPQRASETAKANNANSHVLNLFAYRVAPSGFHASAGMNDTQFIRISTLLTPFPSESTDAAEDADLRILGHAIRVLHSNPILPITAAPLPGAVLPTPPVPTEYRLEAVMQAPAMEELNHIWTTQGGELAYRLSAAYEFSLIPIEPLVKREVASPPRTLVIDAGLGMSGATLEFNPPSADARAIPLTSEDGSGPAPVNWTPVQMLVVGGALTNAATIASTATEATIALAGPQSEEASVEVTWTLADESEDAQPPQIIPIATPLLDAPEAEATVTLAIPATATGGVVRARPADGGAPVAGAAYGNALTLTVEAP